MTTTRPPRILHYAAEIVRRSARRGHPVGLARAERIGRRYLRMAKAAGIQPMYVPSAAERDAENGARLLNEYDNSLRDANQRIAKLERELDLANAHAERLLKERDKAQTRIAELESALDKTMTDTERAAQAQAGLVNREIVRCAICDLVLDPNERQCPRCEQDNEREKREWYRRVENEDLYRRQWRS